MVMVNLKNCIYFLPLKIKYNLIKMRSSSRKQYKSKLKSRTKLRSHTLSRNNNVFRKLKSRSKSKSKKQKKTKRLTKRRKHNNQRKRQYGGECEYLKVQGLTLPDLKIPDQFALISENCQPATTDNVLDGHPNISNS